MLTLRIQFSALQATLDLDQGQTHRYDALKRLAKVEEDLRGRPLHWAQELTCDRDGNRSLRGFQFDTLSGDEPL